MDDINPGPVGISHGCRVAEGPVLHGGMFWYLAGLSVTWEFFSAISHSVLSFLVVSGMVTRLGPVALAGQLLEGVKHHF